MGISTEQFLQMQARLDKSRGSVGAPPSGKVFVLTGQVRGGKNNIVTTRTGKRFPRPEWARWRDDAVRQIKTQLPPRWTPITQPVNVRLDYYAEDRRRRDMPAIVDAIFHVLEKAGVVTDDTLLWVAESSRTYREKNGGAMIEFIE